MVSLATGTGPRRVVPAMWAKRTAKDTRCGRRATQAAGVDEAVAEGKHLSPRRQSHLSDNMVASAVFVLDQKGKIIISRNYRGDIPMSAAEKFVTRLQEGMHAREEPPGNAWPSMRRRRRLRAACLRPAAALCPFFSAHGRPMPSRSLSGQLGSCAGRAGPPLGVRRTAFFLPATSPGVTAARRAALPGPGHLSVPLLRHAVQLSMRSRAVRAMRVSLSPGLHCGRVSTLCQR